MLQSLVDAYHSLYLPKEPVRVREHLPNRSTQRRARVAMRMVTTMALAVVTFLGLALVAQPVTPASAAAPRSKATPTKLIPRVIGHPHRIERPESCSPGPPAAPPPPAITTLAWVAESSTDEVQEIDEPTGALVGSPITVGTSPQGLAYWRPATSSRMDPEVVTSNSGSNSVTLIDAVTSTVLATVSLPSSSDPAAVATSPSGEWALVVDPGTGKVSIINLATDTDEGELSVTSSANVLSSIAFSASGAYAYVTDPTQHKIFVIEHTPGSSPYFATDGNYTNSSYDPAGIATDLSTTSSTALLVTDGVTGGHLLKFNDGSGTLSTPTVVRTFGTVDPGAVALAPGGATAYVISSGTNKVEQITVSSGADTGLTPNSSFTDVGAIGLSADGSTLLSADTGSGGVQGTNTVSDAATNLTTADSRVWAIAPALSEPGSWDAYVADGSEVDVVNTGTLSKTQTIPDSNGPDAIVTSPDGQFVYVVNSVTPSVTVIQTDDIGTSTNPVVDLISLPQGSEPSAPEPSGAAISPSGDTLLVLDSANGAVDVVDLNHADGSDWRQEVAQVGISGSGISSSLQAQAITIGPDGTYVYVAEGDGSLTDGFAVLQSTGMTTTGYSLDADDENLEQGTTKLYSPSALTINPNDEELYAWGYDASDDPAVYELPLAASGQISDGTGAPSDFGSSSNDPADVTFSPEDDLLFATLGSSTAYVALSEPSNALNYTSAISTEYPGPVAASPDGLYLGILTSYYCGEGSDTFQLYNAGSGSPLGSVSIPNYPLAVAFAPQTSPEPISTSELVGGATNPSEQAVTSGMNDVVDAGTPSDAPGATPGVDTATGAYSLAIDSVTIPDVGIPLDETASYDSSQASTNNLLGYGWQYSYGITATQNSHSASINPCAITFTQEDDATVTFYPSAQGPFSTCPTSDYEPRGWAQATLGFQTSCNGSDTCWVLTRDATEKLFVDATTGELMKEEDLNSNTVTITWGSHSACSGATSTEPCQVTAADGIRTLTFSYPSAGTGTCPSGSYICVVVTDPLGRTLTYVKNSTGDLVQISLANGTETATYALTYGSGHLLASWWDPNNEAADPGSTTYATDVTYNTSGPEAGLVSEVTAPPVESVAPLSTTAITPTTTFSYPSYDAATGNGTVLTDNPDFNQSSSESGASQTLDTYADFELVSSVVGYGPIPSYGSSPTVPPNPSESAYPMRDAYNLMPSIAMNALAGTTVGQLGEMTVSGTVHKGAGWQDPTYDNGVVFTTYDARGNALSSTDESGNTSTDTYNGLNEVVSSTDAMGNLTVNSYSSTGELLTTISPPTDMGGSNSETSSYYNSNGTLCASRDADQVATYGVLTSCVSAGSNAATYTYDSSGDQTQTTGTDSSTQTSTTQTAFDVDGNTCATLSPDGYALGDRQTTCPTGGEPYETVTVSHDLYDNPTETISSLSVAGTDTYATSYACTDLNGNTTASVGVMGTAPTCPDTGYTSSVDTTFTTYDPDGDAVQTIAPFAASGAQGPTSTSQFDADQGDYLDLSSQGYDVWEANHSATLSGYETGSLMDDQGNTVATAPEVDTSSSCVDNSSDPCADDSITTYDNQGQQVGQANAGTGQGGSTTPTSTTSVNNPDSSAAGGTTSVGGGSSGITETSQSGYDADDAATNQVTEHWNSSTDVWVTDSATSTAYAPDGGPCWTAPAATSSPSCGSPPTGEATIDYYDFSGNVLAQVGPGGSGTIGESGYCNPQAAVATPYTINTSELCAFTTYSVYNEAGELTKTIEPSASNTTTSYVTAGITTTYAYDPSGNQTSEVNPAGNTVTSTYNAAGELIGITYSDVGTAICPSSSPTYDTCYSYNADGTRSQMVDSTGTTSYTYDGAGDLLKVVDSNDNTVTYGYDGFGQENCISYPGFSTSDTCLAADNPNNGIDTIDPGEVWYSYDDVGRMSSLVDWNGDAFTYGYDCTGDVAWLEETPASQAPTTVWPCVGSGGTVPSPTTPAAPGTTFVVTKYSYSSGGSGNLLTSQATSAVTHSGSTSLLEFDGLAYDDNDDLTSSTPKVSGTTETADTYTYDNQQRVTSGPETSGSAIEDSYTNSNTDVYPTCDEHYCSHNTADQMGIDELPEPGSTALLGAEYAGDGELCWVGVIASSKTGSCASPGSTTSSYETMSYDSSGDLTSTAPTGYGSSSAITWNVDSNEPTCINPSGTTCTGPSSSQPRDGTYTYNGDRLRMSAETWNTMSASTSTTDFTWNSEYPSLLSNGSFDYLYAQNNAVPIAQVDLGTSVTSELMVSPSSNASGLVEVSSSSPHAYVLGNFTDYDSYGTAITDSEGSLNPGGLSSDGYAGDPDSATDFGFGGSFTDSSGFYFLVNRYYSPALGQFISLDPMVAATGEPYAYSSDNPVDNVDPTGTADTSATALGGFEPDGPISKSPIPGVDPSDCQKFWSNKIIAAQGSIFKNGGAGPVNISTNYAAYFFECGGHDSQTSINMADTFRPIEKGGDILFLTSDILDSCDWKRDQNCLTLEAQGDHNIPNLFRYFGDSARQKGWFAYTGGGAKTAAAAQGRYNLPKGNNAEYVSRVEPSRCGTYFGPGVLSEGQGMFLAGGVNHGSDAAREVAAFALYNFEYYDPVPTGSGSPPWKHEKAPSCGKAPI